MLPSALESNHMMQVINLVEVPVLIIGRYDDSFLELAKDVLISDYSMFSHLLWMRRSCFFTSSILDDKLTKIISLLTCNLA